MGEQTHLAPLCQKRNMGSSVSRFETILEQNNGQTEQLPLAAGSLLKGKVVVELKAPIKLKNQTSNSSSAESDGTPPPPSPPVLQLRLYGKEKVRMNRFTAVRTPGAQNDHARKSAERPILNLCLQWPTFPVHEPTAEDETLPTDIAAKRPTVVTVPPGTYVFPFQVPLPASLPSSTYFPVHDNRRRSTLRFRIQYKLVATLNVNNNHRYYYMGGGPYLCTRYLWIAAAAPYPRPEAIPCMVEPVSEQLLKGGRFFSHKKGAFWYGASLENCCVVADDGLKLHLSCRNDSSAVIHQVKISVLEILTWGTAAINHVDPVTGVPTTSSTLQQSQIIPVVVLNDVQLPGFTKERQNLIQSVVRTVFGSPQQRLQRQIYEDLVAGENLITIPLPTTTRESYQGQLIQISHRVQIVFQTGAGARTPILEIPIHMLGTAEPDSRPQPLQPAVASGAGEAYQVAPPPSIQKPTPPTTVETPVKVMSASFQLPAVTSEKGGEASHAVLPPIQKPAPAKPSKVLTPALTGVAVSAEPLETYLSSRKKTSEHRIPVAMAVPIPDDAKEASLPLVDVVVLGGDAVVRPGTRKRMASLANLVPMAAPNVVSVPTLLTELRSAINGYECMADKLRQPSWMALCQKITPEEFGSIISCVHEFDQPRVAVLLAPHLNRGHGGLTCTYVAAALSHTSEHHRAVMAQKLLPLCVDVETQPGLIRAELNEWEQTVTESAFADAIRLNKVCG